MSFPWLTVTGLLPLVGAVVILALPAGVAARARLVALVVSRATLGVVVAMALGFDVSRAEDYRFYEHYPWIPRFGVSYAVGVDGIALVMVALSAVLVPVCVLAGWNEVAE